MVEFPKLAAIENCSSRTTLLSAWCLIFITAITLLLTACGNRDSKVSAISLEPTPVDVVRVHQGNTSLTGTWVGTLDGFVNVQIQPHVSGYLVNQNYREGSPVAKDQVLFEIDPRPFQAAVDQAEAQLKQAQGQLAQAQAQRGLSQINLERDTPLAQARAVAQSRLDNEKQQAKEADAAVVAADAAVSAADASLTNAKLNLEFTQVHSLVHGVAGQAMIQVGNLVSPESLLTSVSQLNPIKVFFSISDTEYLDLVDRAHDAGGDLLSGHSTLPLTLTLANGTVWPRKGHIAFVDRQMNQQTGAIRIAASFPNPDNLLRPGQFGRVTAETEIRRNAILVPQLAVQDIQGTKQLYIAGPDNRAHTVNVTLGPQTGNDWIITSGIHPGELVITSNLQKLRDGAPLIAREISEQAAIETSSPTGAR